MTVTEPSPGAPAVSSSDVLEDNDQKPMGFGRMLRKEDPRLVRGAGNFTDDIKLKGMLHMEILRSPYAHATILSIDKSQSGGNC